MPPLDETKNIVGVDEALIALGLSENDHNRIERLINAASSRLENFCRQPFKARQFTKTMSGPNHPLLDLGGRIVSVTSITVGGTALASDDYKILSERGQLYRDGGWAAFSDLTGWSAGVNNIVVVATLGFSTIPDDLKEYCLDLIRYLYVTQGTEAYASERIGDYSYTKAQLRAGLPEELAARLEDSGYVRW